jgi:hypothetical protein
MNGVALTLVDYQSSFAASCKGSPVLLLDRSRESFNTSLRSWAMQNDVLVLIDPVTTFRTT